MDSLPFNLVDVAVIAVVVLSGVLALVRGFVREVLAIVAWIGAAVAVMEGLPLLLPHVRAEFGKHVLVDIGVGIAIFLVALIVLSLLFRWLARAVQGTDLGALDRSLGFLFGLIRGLVVVALFYIVGSLLVEKPEHPLQVREARVRPVVEYVAKLIASVAPPQVLEALEAEAKALPRPTDLPAPLTDKPGETGYKAEDRKDLDRLFGNTQER